MGLTTAGRTRPEIPQHDKSVTKKMKLTSPPEHISLSEQYDCIKPLMQMQLEELKSSRYLLHTRDIKAI